MPLCEKFSVREITYNTVLQNKKWSVAEARSADPGSYRHTKQESADRFCGSIRMHEIFQFEVWNSSNFVIIFSFIEKSVTKKWKLIPLIDAT